MGKDFPNTPMLGALVKMTKIVNIDSIGNVLAARFKGTLLASNAEALRLGYEGVRFA
jgi:Pyruvate/2-oxoacid:ferredoxin oxidoreductase gamma subunit